MTAEGPIQTLEKWIKRDLETVDILICVEISALINLAYLSHVIMIVFSFKQCVTEGWSDVIIGMKVEVALPKAESIFDETVYWIANVIRIAG